MSIYKEYKMGMVDDAEFRMATQMEFAGDDDFGGECKCHYCIHYQEGTDTECDLPSGKCRFVGFD